MADSKNGNKSEGLSTRDTFELTLKGLVGAIPYVGGFLSIAIFEAMDRKRQNRLEAFVKELAGTLGSFGDKIDKDYFETDEFEGIFRKTLQKVQVEPDPAKQQLAHNLLSRNTIEGETNAYDFDAYVIELVGQLTTLHFECLFALGRTPQGRVASAATGMRHLVQAGFHWKADVADAVKCTEREVEPILLHLASLGLCLGTDGMQMIGGVQASTKLTFRLTEAGRRVLERVQDITAETVAPAKS